MSTQEAARLVPTVDGRRIPASKPKQVWIDLDNSPHVPFFVPIIEELERRGHSVLITARDCFQVCELADLFELKYKPLGRHYGKVGVLKLAGTCIRSLQLAPTVMGARPDLAVSHGSRSQLLICSLLRVPSVVIIDYEFAKGLVLLRPNWVMTPETIPDTAIHCDKRRLLKYPGIKEDVYVPRFKPDARLRTELGLDDRGLVVTVRPPANEAHYRSTESDMLFHEVITFLAAKPDVRIVLLPRNQRQEAAIRNTWAELFANGKVVIPAHAVDGLNLIWHSDLVISGGGTMNREAAALGVPVYSIFRGKIGAVDHYLANAGRLVLLESIGDVRTKIALKRRQRPETTRGAGSSALNAIADNLMLILDPEQKELNLR
jgi:predicted glycosyltransferase